MKNMIFALSARIENLKMAIMKEDGQDLVEYALVVALIALGATAGMSSLAHQINNAFDTVGNNLTNNV